MANKTGSRVLAILDAQDGVVRSFGEGIYVGDKVPGPEVGGLNLGFPNPCIELDNGKTVFGCECWWGSADTVKARFPADKWTWEEVDIDEYRKASSGEAQEEEAPECTACGHNRDMVKHDDGSWHCHQTHRSDG